MKILVGYDVSKDSDQVLELAKKHALAFDADLYLFVATMHSPEVHAPKLEKIEKRLEKLQNDFKQEGFRCHTHIAVRSLSPGEDMLDFARTNHIDEIIIGVKHRSKIGKLIMGSTAQYVILEALCPVVTVKS